MKVFITVDLEGITGISTEEQTDLAGPDYGWACAAMRADLDAAIEGCFDAKASEIVVCDAHAAGRNMNVSDLPEGVSMAGSRPSALDMMTGIDDSYDACLFVGYHARAGTQGAVLEHTYLYKVFSVSIGDREVGEFEINALLAGHFGVPPAFLSGDDKAVAEARERVPSLPATVVKTSLARTCAISLSPAATSKLIREEVGKALTSRLPEPLTWDGSLMRLVFARAHHCDAASSQSGVRRIDGRTVEVPGDSYLDLFKKYLACLELANAAGAPRME